MIITMRSTDAIAELDGVACRVWDGVTTEGTKVKVFVHRVAVHATEDAAAFERELKEQLPPGRHIPLSLIL